ncbi:hypothetical protein [Pseudomonas nitroreducens]|uniref:Lipoprotein n=1 Tax=Pseudomonas nitroreducens TaxID=46680 RepID=A0A6G6J3C2_PSENT|nr:hypothetical protein [Pseudomonas nitroreducens]QIE89762.1 hypothetical protein G5B91_27280 [Pseudomonas nitroreducens]
MKANLAVFLCFLTLAACSDENSKLRGQFIAGCIQGGAPKSICACTFKKLEEQYSPAELQKLNTPYKAPPESFVKDTMRAALACQTE